MWRVVVDPRANKALATFPLDDQGRILAALRSMTADPFSGDIRKLEDGSYRRRVGSFRLIFSVARSERTVRIERVARRTSTTY